MKTKINWMLGLLLGVAPASPTLGQQPQEVQAAIGYWNLKSATLGGQQF